MLTRDRAPREPRRDDADELLLARDAHLGGALDERRAAARLLDGQVVPAQRV